MKLAIVLAAIFLSCTALPSDEVAQKWLQFQNDFGKSYKSPVEATKRFGIFKNNLANIEEHNQKHANGEVTWTKTITKFADWTSEEFLEYVNKGKLTFGTFPEELVSTKGKKVNLTGDIPDSIDWRDSNAVSEVKDQGSCGSCWSFSATGAMEGQFAIEKGNLLSLSEQNLIDCATLSNGYSESGCNGGNMMEAFRFAWNNGIDTEAAYPYEGVQKTCRQQGSDNKLSGYVPVSQSEERLLESVAIIGPISVGIEATDNLQLYGGGVLYDNSCSGQLNHGVLAIGYGNQDGQDYWLVKNSWGPNWGENGFFKLSRKDNNCGIQNMASYPFVF